MTPIEVSASLAAIALILYLSWLTDRRVQRMEEELRRLRDERNDAVTKGGEDAD